MLISPIIVNMFGARCRFSITCSEYAIGRIGEEGIIMGSLKTIKRILRCQPFTKVYEYS